MLRWYGLTYLHFLHKMDFQTFSGMRNQNELAKESSEVTDFWNMLQGWQSIGKCVEKVHFNIRYLTKFRPMLTNMDIEFKEAHPILYLNMAAISSLFSSRNSTQNITANRSSWSTILSYLKSHPAFLGLKQDRFHIILPTAHQTTSSKRRTAKCAGASGPTGRRRCALTTCS